MYAHVTIIKLIIIAIGAISWNLVVASVSLGLTSSSQEGRLATYWSVQVPTVEVI